jgi:putative PIN family toxin of toxin-antitoxin system
VLDTNVLVSALLFDTGRLSWLRPCWQSGQVVPVLAQPTALELVRVLAYPKFQLEAEDRERLLEDLLPWCESWSDSIPGSGVSVRDPHDQVFLDLALAAATPVLVTGDVDLLALQELVRPLQIVNPASFRCWLGVNTCSAVSSSERGTRF